MFGLFKRDKKENATPVVKKPTPDELESALKLQDKIYKELDKDYPNESLEDTIKRYEKWLTPQYIPIIRSQCFLLSLPSMYIANGQNDKAWGFYNLLLISDCSVSKDKIRDLQAKFMKKEKNHIEAIKFFMLKYYEKFQWQKRFDKDAFAKDIGVSVRALKWSVDNQYDITTIAEQNILSKKPNQSKMLKEYAQYISNLKE